MKFANFVLSLALICAAQNLGAQQSGTQKAADLSNLVVIGDSLSAGVQNFSLLDTQQPNGYAAVLASQAEVPLILPLIPSPGIPNVLQLVSFGPPPVIQPATGTLPFPPRDNPSQQPTNLAIPGITVHDALTLRPSLSPASAVGAWATVVLGFPELEEGQAPTQVELATSLHPTTLIEWLGNNDALVPALIGQITQLTPPDQFARDYLQVLDSFTGNGPTIVVATIPDVTAIPYFTSAKTIAQQANLPLWLVTSLLGINAGDYVRPSAQPLISQILSGQTKGPLPANCPAPLSNLGTNTVPCVLTAQDATTVRLAIDSYNNLIKAQIWMHGAVVVDIHALLQQIASQGYQTDRGTLTTAFLGGIFSLDGIHPTNTGYGIIANEFIRTMNLRLHSSIPPADINKIAEADPLIFSK